MDTSADWVRNPVPVEAEIPIGNIQQPSILNKIVYISNLKPETNEKEDDSCQFTVVQFVEHAGPEEWGRSTI